MKHTIKERHGHMYTMNKTAKLNGLFERVCVSAKHAAAADLASEHLKACFRVSRRFHVCGQCHNPTERVGGWADPAGTKILYYECASCDGMTRTANKK